MAQPTDCSSIKISIQVEFYYYGDIYCTLTEQARREGFKSASSIARDISTTTNTCRIWNAANNVCFPIKDGAYYC